MRKKISILLGILAVIGLSFLWYENRGQYSPPDLSQYNTEPIREVQDNKEELPKNIVIQVPFQAQAPFGDWADPRQQSGCEEASMVMAAYSVQKRNLTAQTALKEILALADFETQMVGTFHDTSVEDTAKIYNSYFKDSGHAEAKKGINIEDIKKELAKGNLVLVPTNGQKLKNPNYTQPGPTRHMLVLRGYDDAKKIFITNDPGTRRGEGYIFPYETVLNAILNYPTGHEDPVNNDIKVMIVVSND